MSWAGHVARMRGEERRIRGFDGETWGKETTFGDPDVEGRIILRWIFKKWGYGIGSSWLGIGTGGGHL